MPAKPKRTDRQPAPDARFLSGVVAANIRAFRAGQELTQDDVTQAMHELGHNWARQSLSEVERGGRHLTVDELGSLAVALGVPLTQLLDPLASGRTGIDTGLPPDHPDRVMDPALAYDWVRGRVVLRLRDGQLSAVPNPAQKEDQ